MALYMDISRNDKQEVNSVLVGCSCGPRAIFVAIAEAQQWGYAHITAIHEKDYTTAIEQIGEPLRVKKIKPKAEGRPTPSQDALLSILALYGGELSTREVADLSGKTTKDTVLRLNKMHARGLVTKTVISRQRITWKAAA